MYEHSYDVHVVDPQSPSLVILERFLPIDDIPLTSQEWQQQQMCSPERSSYPHTQNWVWHTHTRFLSIFYFHIFSLLAYLYFRSVGHRRWLVQLPVSSAHHPHWRGSARRTVCGWRGHTGFHGGRTAPAPFHALYAGQAGVVSERCGTHSPLQGYRTVVQCNAA